MKLSYVLTVIADDEPGIVERLSDVIKAHQGNWLKSRMANLAGKFAGVLHIEVPATQGPELESALKQLAHAGIEVRAELGKESEGETHQMTLNLVGNDRPGIVRELSGTLAEMHINVLELLTNCGTAEMSSQPLFRAEALLQVPLTLDIDDVKAAIEDLGNELMVEIKLGPAQ